ncbi:MAG: hypothetical protein LBT59_22810 [Clostridiales bacterium]|nr:hypothetical protein [Clostridiales bacterium]
MEINDMLTQFKDLGVSLVINGVFLYAALQFINIGINMLKAKQKVALEALTHNNANSKTPQPDPNKTPASAEEASSPPVRRDAEIRTLMDRIMRDCGGDRVTIMEFNTPNAPNLSLLPFQFMSCTYDIFREKKLPVSHIMQNISTSLFSKFLVNLQTAPYVILNTEDQAANSQSGYDLVRAQDEKMSLCVSIRDKDSKPIGYTALKKDTQFTESDIDRFTKYAKEVSFLLA